jgi:RHS repeat-associated protein
MNYVIKDHLGSTRVMINTTDLPYALTTYDYSAFGTILTTPTSSAYLYTGQEWDQTSGLHNFKARMYDSDLAMFYGADPGNELVTPFSFVGNNPVTRRDPSGKFIQLAAIAYYAYKAYQVYSIARAAYGIYQATKYGGIGGFVQGLTAAGISYGIGSVAGGFAGDAGVPTLAGSIRGGIASSLAVGTLGAHATGRRASLGWNTVFDAGVGGLGGALAYGSQVHTANQAANADNRDPRAPVPFEQQELDRVIDESEQLSTMRNRGGNPSTKIVNSVNLAETGTDKYETQDGNLINKTSGESVGAKTFDVRGSSFYRADGSIGSRSQILVSRQAFSSYGKLYLTLGHEFVHAIQNYSGLSYKWVTQYRESANRYSEIHAYTWTQDAAIMNGWTWELSWINSNLNYYQGGR